MKLDTLFQPAADGSNTWRGRGEIHQIDRQTKHHSWTATLPIYRQPHLNDTLALLSEFESHLFTKLSMLKRKFPFIAVLSNHYEPLQFPG
jgi:hypothetical protein